jgi:biopolymer transport protein TolR
MAGGMIGGGKGKGRYRPMAEINVTPLVDVMLVLLIVFMVTAPLITQGVSVNLPKASAAPLAQDVKPITLTVDPQGNVFLSPDTTTPIQLPNLVAALNASTQSDQTRRIVIRGDKDVPYGTMLQVMAAITQGGYDKVALQTSPADQGQ